MVCAVGHMDNDVPVADATREIKSPFRGKVSDESNRKTSRITRQLWQRFTGLCDILEERLIDIHGRLPLSALSRYDERVQK